MFYIVLNIVLFLISLFLIYSSFKSSSQNDSNSIARFVDKHYKLLVIFPFLIMLFTTVYNLDKVPYGMHVDEAGMAYDAFNLAKYGVDRYLNKFPIYLINFGGGQSAMYSYLTAALIKIFGYSIFVVRTPAVLFRIISFICGYFLVKSNKNKINTLTFLYLLAFAPYFIMQSRWDLDCNLLVSFLTISICLLIKAIEKNNNYILVCSGILFGLSLYTYALSYLIIPLFLLLICIYLLYIKKFNLGKLIILGFPIFILSLPLMLMILINNGLLSEINSFITIPILPNYRGAEISVNNIINNLSFPINLVTFDQLTALGGNLIYNSIPYFWYNLLFINPFFGNWID